MNEYYDGVVAEEWASISKEHVVGNGIEISLSKGILEHSFGIQE